MSREDFARDWIPYRDAILSTYPELTFSDLEAADGSTDALAQRIAEVKGTDVAEARQTLHEFLATPMPADAYAAPTHDNAAVRDSAGYIPEGEDPMADDRRFGDDNTPSTPMGRDR